jgi:hypothetical protein
MPYYVLIPTGDDGSLDLRSVEPPDVTVSSEELLRRAIAERDRVLLTDPASLLASQQALGGAATMDLPYQPPQELPKCPHCEFKAATEQGLTSHIRNRHKDLKG